MKSRRKFIMKKSMFVLFIMSMVAFAEGTEIKKVHTKTAKLEKDSYCNIPKVYSDFKKINEKDYKVDVDFEKCVFDGETYNNVKVSVLIQDTEKTEKYLKKYKYMHLKAGRNLVYNADRVKNIGAVIKYHNKSFLTAFFKIFYFVIFLSKLP